MTKYEKLSTLDGLAYFIYDTDNEGEACRTSPFRDGNGDCPLDEDDIGIENRVNCIKEWLLGAIEE